MISTHSTTNWSYCVMALKCMEAMLVKGYLEQTLRRNSPTFQRFHLCLLAIREVGHNLHLPLVAQGATHLVAKDSSEFPLSYNNVGTLT